MFEVPGAREEEAHAAAAVALMAAVAEKSEVAGREEEEEAGSNLDFVEELPFEEEEDGYISSSCSISMSSDVESSHQITVPVFIEPAPPEIRRTTPPQPPPLLLHHQPLLAGEEAGGGGGLLVGSSGSDLRGLLRGEQAPRLIHQETMHTDSGLDTEDICPASPTNSRFSADLPDSPKLAKHGGPSTVAAGSVVGGGNVSGGAFDDDSLRLVLVRDIGIQCCAESPNLSMRRRQLRSADNEPVGAADIEACDDDLEGQRTSNLTRHLSAELLF